MASLKHKLEGDTVGLASLNLYVPNLPITAQNILSDPVVGPITRSSPSVDAPLVTGTQVLNIGGPVLGQSSGGSLAGLDLIGGSGAGAAAPSLDLNTALSSLTQSVNTLPLSTPEVSDLSSVVNNVLSDAAVDANIDLDVNLGASSAPLIDLGVSLGADDLALNISTQVLGRSAGTSPLGLDLGTGAGTGTTTPTLDLDGALASLAQALAAPPISTPALPDLPGLVNSILDAGGIDANVDLNVNLGTPGEPLLDLGVSLGSDGSVLDLGAELLDPNAGGSLLDVDLNLGTAPDIATPSLDLSPVVDLLTGTTPTALSTGLPQLPALGELVNDVVEAVGLDNVVDIEMGSGTPSSPALELDVALGGSGSAEPAIDPATDTVSDPGTATIPSTTPSEPASLPDLVNEVIDAVGLDDLLGIDLGSGAAPSTNAPATPATPATSGTGTTVGAEVTVGSGGVDVGVNLGGSGGTTTSGGTTVPTTSGGSPGSEVSTGTHVSTGGGGTTGTVSVGGTSGTHGHASSGGVGSANATDIGHDDWMVGGNGHDTLMGLTGNDTLFGHQGDDMLLGNQQNDTIYGGHGDDWMHGGQDNDVLYGGDGDDDIWGGRGDDLLDGGDGADTFFFAMNSGNDIISDFNFAEGDRLDFQGQSYSVGDLNGSAVLTLSGGGSVVMNGVSATEFNSYAFA